MDLESGLFRIFDEALAAYLGAVPGPGRAAARLDAERLEGHVSASRDRTSAIEQADRELAEVEPRCGPRRRAVPARRERSCRRRWRRCSTSGAPPRRPQPRPPGRRRSSPCRPPTWREIQQRAATVGVEADLVGDGGELRISVDLPTPDAEAAPDADGQGAEPRPVAAGRVLREWWSEEVGQGLVEYGLILVLSALVAVVVLVFFGGTISAVLEAIGEAIERAS